MNPFPWFSLSLSLALGIFKLIMKWQKLERCVLCAFIQFVENLRKRSSSFCRIVFFGFIFPSCRFNNRHAELHSTEEFGGKLNKNANENLFVENGTKNWNLLFFLTILAEVCSLRRIENATRNRNWIRCTNAPLVGNVFRRIWRNQQSILFAWAYNLYPTGFRNHLGTTTR